MTEADSAFAFEPPAGVRALGAARLTSGDGLRSAALDLLRSQPHGLLLSGGLIGFVLACLLAATGAVNGPLAKFNSQIVLVVCGIAGFKWLILHSATRPSRTEVVSLAIALVLGTAVCVWAIPNFWTRAASSYYFTIAPLAIPGVLAAGITIFRYQQAHQDQGAESEEVRVLGGAVAAMAFALLFILSADVLLAPTQLLHPQTFDARAWLIDEGYGVQVSNILAGMLSCSDVLRAPAWIAYQALGVAISVLYAVQLRSAAGRPQVWNFLLVWAALTVAAILAYHLFPITGPKYWLGEHFYAPIDPLPFLPTADPILVVPDARNGMPSMHFGWAFAMWVVARWIGKPWVTRGFAALALTMVVATLGLGEHYLIDLVVALPFVVAVLGATMHDIPWSLPERRYVAFGGALLYFSWIALLRWGDTLLLGTPAVLWSMTALTVAFTWRAIAAFDRIKQALSEGRLSGGYAGIPLTRQPRAASAAVGLASQGRVLGMFLLSGFASLIYEVLFTKQLALVFGSNAEASYSVLVAYMGGMAFGAWLGGRIYSRFRSGLRLYFGMEVVVGLYCLTAPALLTALQTFYVWSAAGVPPATWWLVPLRIGLGVALLCVPTIMMGATLPVLVAHLRDRAIASERAVATLYGVNTLGAAVGAFCAGYLIIPALGLRHTTLLAAMLNLLVGLMALQVLKREGAAPLAADEPAARAKDRQVSGRRGSILALIILALTGLVAMVVETNYVHLLAVVAGTSAYAFALMLATFLLGLGAGSLAMDRLPNWKRAPAVTAGLLLSGLTLTLALGALQWGAMSDYFASYARYPFPREFGAHELVRGMVCFLAMFPPALCIGALYPVAVHWAVPDGDESRLGRAFAVNTVGNIAGILLGGFVLLPSVGANAAAKIGGVVCALLALAAFASIRGGVMARAVSLCAVACGALALVVTPWQLDMSRVATGANVYFASPNWGRVIDHAESIDGGLTAVSVASRGDAGTVLTLTTNGKFQGNNAPHGEMRAQLGFALTPLLHQPARGSALVIGYGTGMSAHALHEAGFSRLVIADLSRDIVDVADRHFGDINGHVSSAPGVSTHIVDGRNFLLLQRDAFDLIGIEVSSIWFAGTAALYNREFYELAHARLKPEGVLQQWVQLHHMSREDLLRIIGSVRAVFPYVWLYVVGGQGMIIAGSSPAIEPKVAYADALRRSPRVAGLLEQVGSSIDEVSAARLLDPPAVDRLLGAMGVGRDYWVSTDDNSLLEYSTPRGNVLDGQESFKANMRLLTNGSAKVTPAPVEAQSGSAR